MPSCETKAAVELCVPGPAESLFSKAEEKCRALLRPAHPESHEPVDLNHSTTGSCYDLNESRLK